MCDAFSHEALLYAGADEFMAGTVPFIREGVEEGESVMVAVSEPKIERLTSELDEAAGRVLFVNMEQLGANPARIIPAWRAFLDENMAVGRGVRGIGEPIWPERGADELVECQRHEALLNLAFGGSPAWRLLCPYDIQRLPDEVLAEARRSHPVIRRRGVDWESGTYLEDGALDAFAGELPPPPPDAREVHFSADYLRDVREIVLHRSQDAGLDPRRAQDLVLAVNELATNSTAHGGGTGVLSVWCDGGAMVCEVRDEGQLTDPLAGRCKPQPGQPRGRGLYLVNQVCDLVQIRSTAAGTAVRAHMALS